MMAKGDIRRGALLAVGFGAGFCVLWLLVANAGIMLTHRQTQGPALHFQARQTQIQLPYTIEGTTLIAEQLASYDGPFMEDGSHREVMNVTALRLRNCGTDGIENAQVILERGEDRLLFEVDTLPAGASVLVLEKNAAAYSKEDFTACYGWATLSKNNWIADSLQIREVDMGTIEVTNLTGSELKNIRLYYKNCLTQADLYIGGSSYSVGIECLEPGKTLLLFPSHYASGYSRIARVEIAK